LCQLLASARPNSHDTSMHRCPQGAPRGCPLLHCWVSSFDLSRNPGPNNVKDGTPDQRVYALRVGGGRNLQFAIRNGWAGATSRSRVRRLPPRWLARRPR